MKVFNDSSLTIRFTQDKRRDPMTCQSLVFDMTKAIQRSCGKEATHETKSGLHVCSRHFREENTDLYAKTLIPLVPDNPEDGPGIPAGVVVKITEHNSELLAHYEGVTMDVLSSEIDTDV
jgi:hypothetical protein